MAPKKTSKNTDFDIDEEASWLNVVPALDFSSWTHERDLRERNKALRRIYEESGREDYGRDVRAPGTSAAAKAAAAAELRKRTAVALELRNKHIKEVVSKMGAARRLDLCFLVDITGSMDPHIQGVKDSIHAIVDRLLATPAVAGQKRNASAMTTTTLVSSSLAMTYTSRPIVKMIRLAFVGYRDIKDAVPFETLQFTESVDQFYSFCGSLVATGGEDEPEDVFGGLEKATQLGWTTDGSTRMLFHIADAPCHGTKFHSLADDFPGGDPKGRSLESLLDQLANNDIQYHFGKINNSTKKMVEAFAQIYAGDLVVCEMKNADQLLDNVISTASIAVTRVVAKSVRKNARTKVDFERTLPNWAELPVQNCTLLSYEMPAVLDDLISGVPLTQKTPLKALVKIAKKPFAAGAERWALYGQDVTNEGAEPTSIVLKKYSINSGGGGGHLHASIHYEMAIQMQTIAAYLAAKFSDDMMSKIGRGYPIKFLKTQVLSYVDATNGERVFMACEKSYPAGFQYLRFTNNMDYTMLELTAKSKCAEAFIAQLFAFSHWTYEVTNGQLMVVDLQGIISTDDGGARRIELTDPAIHAVDIARFGRTNLGEAGMRAFFSSHVCNDVCKQMDLVVPEKFRNLTK